MLRGFIALFLLLVTSCSITTNVPKDFEYPITCDKYREIKYCEGWSPFDMECRCMQIEGGFSEHRVA